MIHLRYYPKKYLKAVIHDMNMNDADAYTAIYALTCKDLYRSVIRITGDAYQTEQILKETFLELFLKKRHTVDPDAFIRKLKKSACTKASEYLRSHPKGNATASSYTPKSMELLLPLILVQAGRKEGEYSFETMSDYAVYRSRLSLFDIVFFTALFIFLIDVILNFIPAKITMVPGETPSKPVVLVKVDSLMGIQSIEADIDGSEMRITQEANGMYLIRTNKNGTLTVTVTQAFGFLNQKKTLSIMNVDDQAPSLVSSEVKDDRLIIVVADEKGSIDFEGIYGIKTDDNIVPFISYDEKTNTIIFNNDPSLAKIVIPDAAGNTLSLNVTH